MTHCEHLTLPGPSVEDSVFYTGASNKGNCKIYPASLNIVDQRPKCCDEYKCLWVQGYGGEEDRPDKSLILFDESRGVENAIEAKPLSGSKETTKEGAEVIRRMSISTGKPVLVFNLYEGHIVQVVGLPKNE